jgi:predicted Rossmann fold flavoprotein
MSEEKFDVAIVGAGAAGLMCAIEAGRRGRRVLLLDHADQAGKKILISGGGRCNFTNREVQASRFLSANPHFCKSALARYTQNDFIGLVEKHNIAYHEKVLGQLFCDGSARQVVAMLLEECRLAGVDLRLSRRVTGIAGPGPFRLALEGEAVAADALVVATGGPSIPKMGATRFAYDIARQFGLKITAVRPGLVPLTFADAALDLMRPLSGVATDVIVQCGRHSFREAMLFTHRGLSGPAILQISSYWQEGADLLVNLLPGVDAATLLLAQKRARPRAEARTILAELLPSRLADALAQRHLPPRAMADQTDRDLNRLAAALNAWRLKPAGTEGFAKAEVTLGGVDTDGLSSKTMEARAVPGLYFIGEAVDVTGWLGGYNFQWAWSSGWVAGQSVSPQH